MLSYQTVFVHLLGQIRYPTTTSCSAQVLPIYCFYCLYWLLSGSIILVFPKIFFLQSFHNKWTCADFPRASQIHHIVFFGHIFAKISHYQLKYHFLSESFPYLAEMLWHKWKNLLNLCSLHLPINSVLSQVYNSLVIWQGPLTDCLWKPNIICEEVYTQHMQILSRKVEENKTSEILGKHSGLCTWGAALIYIEA